MIERFTKEEFEEALSRHAGEWECVFDRGEYRYSSKFGDNAVIFVSSSIGSDGHAKPKGEDSIRVYAMYRGKYLSKTQRWVTRISGWENRLGKAIRETRNTITDLDYAPRCPACGSHMVIRKGVHGSFWGCISFPRCRGTRNIPNKEIVNDFVEKLNL